MAAVIKSALESLKLAPKANGIAPEVEKSHGDLPIIWKSEAPEDEYDQARVGRVFNHRRPKRYPVAVVEPETVDHVVAAVKLAKERNLRVSIRSGGHSWAAWSVRDGAILIDFGKFKHLDFDEATGRVEVSPSTTGRVLNGVLVPQGWFFPGGHCPDVGLGGFLLQGGMGWVCRGWGWACQYVKAVDVVTADGELLHCNDEQNQDLYWAARGSGPGFPAIVTRFYLQAKRLPTHIRSSVYLFPKECSKDVLNWVAKSSNDYDPDTEIVAVGAYIPDHEESIILASFVAFKWDEDDALKALLPAEESIPKGFIRKSFNKPTTMQEQYAVQGASNPQGHRYCADNGYLRNDADVGMVLEKSFTTLPGRKTFSLYFSMNPTSRRPLPDMALSMHTDHYFASYTIWEDEKDDDKFQAWTRHIMKGIAPHCEGQYLGDSDFQVRNTKYWQDQQGERLREIRRKRNPDGRVCGYLDSGDRSGVDGLSNQL